MCFAAICTLDAGILGNPFHIHAGIFRKVYCRICLQDLELLASGPPTVAPCLPFGFEEAFKEGRGIQGGKSIQGGKEAFKEGKGILGGKFLVQTKRLQKFLNFFLKFESFIFFQLSMGHGESIGTLGFKIHPLICPNKKMNR